MSLLLFRSLPALVKLGKLSPRFFRPYSLGLLPIFSSHVALLALGTIECGSKFRESQGYTPGKPLTLKQARERPKNDMPECLF